MSRAYQDGKDGGLYTGGGNFTDYLKGQTASRYTNPNQGGTGNGGCGVVILFFIGLWLLLLLPITVPAAISAFIMALIINKFGHSLLSLSISPTFGQAFKATFFTYLWYIPISIVIGIGLSFFMIIIVSFSANYTEINNIENEAAIYYRTALILLAVQIPNFLIAGAIFRKYISKYLGNVRISYWRSTLFMSFASIIWLAMVVAVYYFWSKFFPETFQEMLKTLASPFN